MGCSCHTHHHEEHKHENENRIVMIVRLLVSAGLLVVAFFLQELTPYLQIVAYLVIGYDVVIEAIKGLLKARVFNENLLMLLATICAFLIKEYNEAVLVLLLYQLGEMLQDIAKDNSEHSITKLLDLKVDVAHIEVDGKIEDIESEHICVGDVIVIRAGERIPVDGEIIDGESSLNLAPLTGEERPVSCKVGDRVLSGSINLTGLLRIKADKVVSESTASKILECIKTVGEKKTKSERFITRFSKIYTPVVVCIAVLLATVPLFFGKPFSEWGYIACIFLVVSCPCALVISVPLSFFLGIGKASRLGVIIKGSDYLERLDKLNILLLDKTGTLTEGKMSIIDVVGEDKERIFFYAAVAEHFSTHPIALAIKAENKIEVNESKIQDYQEIAGEGITVKYDDCVIKVGKKRFAIDQEDDKSDDNTTIYISLDNKYLGHIVLGDCLKKEAKETIRELRELGVEPILVSGDNKRVVEKVSEELNINQYHAELLPIEKVNVLEQYMNGKNIVGFVGDGINDAPVIRRSDVGISMGGLGSQAAIEASDIVISNDNLQSIVEAKKVAKKTRKIIIENISVILLVKIVAIILGILGILPIWGAIASDVGVCLLAIIGSYRLLVD